MTKRNCPPRVGSRMGVLGLSLLLLTALAAEPLAAGGPPASRELLGRAPAFAWGNAVYTFHGGRWWTRPAASARADFTELRGPAPAQLESWLASWRAAQAAPLYAWPYYAYSVPVDGFSRDFEIYGYGGVYGTDLLPVQAGPTVVYGSTVYQHRGGHWWTRGVREPESAERRFYGTPPRRCLDALRTWRQPGTTDRAASWPPATGDYDWQRGSSPASRFDGSRAGLTGWPVHGRPTDGAVRGPTLIVRGHVYRYADGQWWTRPNGSPDTPESPLQGTPPAECVRSLADWQRRVPRITDNTSPLPRDRVIFGYDTFRTTRTRTPGRNAPPPDPEPPTGRPLPDKWRDRLRR